MSLPKLNILLLGGAKRVSMARFLVSAAEIRGFDVDIFSYELHKHCPIACEATVLIGKRWRDPDIFDHLTHVVITHNINIIIPFVDPAVEITAVLVERLSAKGINIFAPVSAPGLSEAMFDKVRANDIFRQASIPVPTQWDGNTDTCHNLIAKPRHGSASQGLIVIRNADDMAQIKDRQNDFLIQEYIDPHTEYTVDCYVSTITGAVAAAVPRLRLAVSGGEVTETKTVLNPAVRQLAIDTLKATGLRGAITVQVIERTTPCDNRPSLMVMEVNPRLGGGAVCSVLAGCDIPAMIIDEAMGTPAPAYDDVPSPALMGYMPNVLITRYPQEVVFYPEKQ